MATLKYESLSKGTLANSIDASTTSIILNSGQGAKFPSAGDFWIIIEPNTANEEICKCTSRSTDTLTVTRGQEGTSAVSHGNNGDVFAVLTKAALDQLRIDLCQSGTDANKPATEKQGILYLPTNSSQIYRDNGSNLRSWGPLFHFPDPVIDGDYAWINQSTSVIITANGPIILEAPASTGTSYRIRKKAAPSTPYTISVAIMMRPSGDGDTFVGLIFRESSTGKLHAFVISNQTTGELHLQLHRFTDEVTYSSTQFDKGKPLIAPLPIVWLRIKDDGTNLTYFFSIDGQNWSDTILTESRTVHMAGGPNEVGFALNHANAAGGTKPALYVFNWTQG